MLKQIIRFLSQLQGIIDEKMNKLIMWLFNLEVRVTRWRQYGRVLPSFVRRLRWQVRSLEYENNQVGMENEQLKIQYKASEELKRKVIAEYLDTLREQANQLPEKQRNNALREIQEYENALSFQQVKMELAILKAEMKENPGQLAVAQIFAKKVKSEVLGKLARQAAQEVKPE